MSGRSRAWSVPAFVLFFSLASAGAARADIIGSFSWDDCGIFDPCFTVGNFSDGFIPPGIDFTSASVTLSTDQGSQTEDLGDIGAGFSATTLGDYSLLQISLVVLSLSTNESGTFTLVDALGHPVAGLMMPGDFASIDFEPSSQAVPEPPTLILLAAGIGVLGLESRRKRRTARAVRARG